MKVIIFYILFALTSALAGVGAEKAISKEVQKNVHGKKTAHKTATGKYTIYYEDDPTDPNDSWTEEDQKEFDNIIDEALNNLCLNSELVRRAQETIAHEKAVGKTTGIVNAKAIHDAGSMLVTLKPKIEAISKVIKDKTGRDASDFECP